MLLLISSNAAQRYRDDIVRLLAQPSGTDVQFRYDLKHLDPKVLARVKQNKLGEEKALVCFMMTDATTKLAHLVSARRANVRQCAIVGSSCIMTLTAADYVRPLDDAAIRSMLTPEERALLPSYAGKPPLIEGKFAIDVAADITAGRVATLGNEMAAFEETTALLGAFPVFASATGIAFFAIRAIALPDQQWDWFRKRASSTVTYAKGAYELMSGARYELQVYTYRPSGSSSGPISTKLTVDSDEKAVRFTTSKQVVLDSRYDLHRFVFATDDRLDTLPAGLTVALAIADSATPPTFTQRCDVTIRARFEGRRLEAFLRMLMIAGGTSWAALIGVAFKDKFGFWIGVAMCIGPLIAAYVATFPVLRKSN